MLILGRKEGERIHIGHSVTISIESIAKGMVKVGIDAPKDIVILRGELKDKVTQSNLKATQAVEASTLSDISKLLDK